VRDAEKGESEVGLRKRCGVWPRSRPAEEDDGKTKCCY